MKRYRIMCRDHAGHVFKAFTWCRDLHSGLQRAITEAGQQGYALADVWGEEF